MFLKNDSDENEIYDMPPPPMPELSPEEKRKQQKRFHALLVLVLFQSLVIIALFVAIIYKVIDIGINL